MLEDIKLGEIHYASQVLADQAQHIPSTPIPNRSVHHFHNPLTNLKSFIVSTIILPAKALHIIDPHSQEMVSMLDKPILEVSSSSSNLSCPYTLTSSPSSSTRSKRLVKNLTLLLSLVTFLFVISLGFLIYSLIHPFFLQDLLVKSFDNHNTLTLLNHRHDNLHKFITKVENLNKGKDVLPIHSHNDYTRRYPLFDALKLGVNSIEADVWNLPYRPSLAGRPQRHHHLYNHNMDDDEEYEDTSMFDFDDTSLYVGHHKYLLSSFKTLENIYLNPIEDILDEVNSKDVIANANSLNPKKSGVFYNDPDATLYLIIDIKNDPEKVFMKLQSSLRSFKMKNYLTIYDTTTKEWSHGPLTIIISGEIPYNMIKSQKYRNSFIDAPLRKLLTCNDNETISNFASYYPPELSIFGSDSLKRLTGTKKASNGSEGLSNDQLTIIGSIIEKSHQIGIKTRIWDTPSWPSVTRDKIWAQLLDLGVDLLNVDDLKGAVKQF